jgi:hypothetical protein
MTILVAQSPIIAPRLPLPKRVSAHRFSKRSKKKALRSLNGTARLVEPMISRIQLRTVSQENLLRRFFVIMLSSAESIPPTQSRNF